MKIKRRSGFTMVEMLVVFMVMTVLTGVSVPPIQAYYQNTSYKDVQNRAETVFYAAQQTVTAMALSSQIEQFFHSVEKDAFKVDGVLFSYFELEDDSPESNRYYAMRYKRGDLNNPNASNEGKLVLELLQNLVTEKDIFNASITIEVDSYTRTIQTVFYSLEDTTFTYGSGNGIPLKEPEDRSDGTLKERNLGMAEANVSVKVLDLKTDTLPKPFSVPDVNEPNPESDPINAFTKPFSVYIELPAGPPHVRSMIIDWWIPSDGGTITYEYELYYRHSDNGNQNSPNNWKSVNLKDKDYDANTGIADHKINKWTTELRIDILSISSQNSKYGNYKFTVYDFNGSVITPTKVTVISK